MLLGQVHAQGRLDLDSRPVAQGPCGSPGVLYQPGCPPDEKFLCCPAVLVDFGKFLVALCKL